MIAALLLASATCLRPVYLTLAMSPSRTPWSSPKQLEANYADDHRT